MKQKILPIVLQQHQQSPLQAFLIKIIEKN